MRRTAALGHKWPFSTSLAECPVPGVKQPLGTRILEGYDLNASERLLSSKAVVQNTENRANRRATFGQKRRVGDPKKGPPNSGPPFDD